MSVKINYRKMNPTPEITSEIEDEVMAISRFLLKDGRWAVEVGKKKSECFILIKTSSPLGFFQAFASADDFTTAISEAFHKLIQQIKKRKENIQSKKYSSKLNSSDYFSNSTSYQHLYLPIHPRQNLPSSVVAEYPKKKIS